LGLIALVIVLYAGFMWMTSGGNEEKISKAKKILSAGVIGLIIILASYAITSFILQAAQGGGGGGGGGGQGCTPNECTGCYRCDLDGNSHYDETCPTCGSGGETYNFSVITNSPQGENISLCSLIQVKFNNIVDETTVNSQNFGLYDCGANSCAGNLINNLTPDGQFIIEEDIIQFILGEDYEQKHYYAVNIIHDGIADEDGEALLVDYYWEFKTGNETDTEPPTVISVFPKDDQEDVCLTSYITAEFSEDMDMLSLRNASSFYLYEDIDTLSDIDFFHQVYNDSLILYPNSNYEAVEDYFPLLNGSIIKDTCGNYLDGDGDGTHQDSDIDNYPSEGPSEEWNFITGDNLYCTPEITGVENNQTYYDATENLIISGHYLGNNPVLIFDNSIVVNQTSNLCMGNEYWYDGACVIWAWTEEEIKVAIPVTGGDNNGVRAGENLVEVQTDEGNVSANFDLLSPRINALYPDQGGVGQFISIWGINFKEDENINLSASEVYFRFNQDEYIEADLPCGQDAWEDEQIIISAPNNLNINNVYAVQIKKVYDDGTERWSNLADFYFNDEEAGPGLCSIDKDELFFEDEFNLNGIKLGDDIFYNREVILGDDYSSIQADVLEWTGNDGDGHNTDVEAITPLMGSATGVGVRVMVEETAGEQRFSNYLNVEILADESTNFYINYTSPTSTPIGGYVTIYGSGFGNSQDDKMVKFNIGGDDWTDGDFDFPDECSTAFWSDEQVIVKVPETFNGFGFPFSSKIKIIDSANYLETNAVNFEVNNEGLAPCICSVNPEFGTKENEIEIAGEYFEDPDDVDNFYFNTIFDNSGNFISGDYADFIIDSDELMFVTVTSTQTGLISARNINGYGNTWNFEYIEAGADITGVWDFYGWNFTTCADCENPRVSRKICNSNNGISFPSPEPGSTDVPQDTKQVYAAFEYPSSMALQMDTNTLITNNINVYKCASGENPGDCNARVSIDNITATPIFLLFKTVNSLEADYWYKIELNTDITDNEGSSLIPNNSDNNAYEWYFHINKEGGQCEPEQLSIVPENYSLAYLTPKSILYKGFLIDDGCYICNDSGYNYVWDKDDPNGLVNFSSRSGVSSEISVHLNQNYKIGDLQISATSTDAGGNGQELFDKTNLYITANCALFNDDWSSCIDNNAHQGFACCWDDISSQCVNDGSPICMRPFVKEIACQPTITLGSPSPVASSTDVVSNALIYMEFAKSGTSTVDMDLNTYTDNLEIYNCTDVNGSFADDICGNNLYNNLSFNYDAIQSSNSVVLYNHNNFILNTWYKLIATENIQDKYGSSLQPKEWHFKVGAGLCDPTNLEVSPSNWTLEIDESKKYTTYCYDEQCNVCLNNYTYEWEVANPSIAELNPDPGTNSSATSTGKAIGFTQITATTTINGEEISDFGDLTVTASIDNCSNYGSITPCNNSGSCCWDGSDCLTGVGNPACDDEESCNDYGDETACNDSHGSDHPSLNCCWALDGYCTSNLSVCEIFYNCSQFKEALDCEHSINNCCWGEDGECYGDGSPMCSNFKVIENYPEDASTEVCPNTLIRAIFNKVLDADSLAGNVNLYVEEGVGNWSSVTTTLNLYNNFAGQAVLKIIPEFLLDKNADYKVELTDGADGIKSTYGNVLNCSNGKCSWIFATANTVCELNYIEIIDPIDKYYLFTQPNEDKNFIAEGRDINGNTIVSMAGYDWSWYWESLDEDLVDLGGPYSDNVTATAENANGNTIVRVSALPIPSELRCSQIVNQIQCEGDSCCWFNGACMADFTECQNTCSVLTTEDDCLINDNCIWQDNMCHFENKWDYDNKDGYKSGLVYPDEAEVELFMCENIWPNVGSFEDDEYHFRLKYCRDGGLGYLATTQAEGLITTNGDGNELLREYIFKYNNPVALELEDMKDEKTILAQVGFLELFDSRLSWKLLGRMFGQFIDLFKGTSVYAQENNNDIIGLRIYQNLKHLSPLDWYYESAPVIKGNPQPIKVGSYNGLQDGRTVYVNVGELGNDGNLYTNMLLISHSQDVSPATINIFNQLIDNWDFNINIDDLDQRNELVDDVQRWQDIRSIEKKLNDYADGNKFCAYVTDPLGASCPSGYHHFDINGDGVIDDEECYDVSSNVTCRWDSDCEKHEMGFQKCVGVYPELNDGSFLQGISTSKWPSWASTLGNDLGSVLPHDPINEFNSCPTDYDEQTCWHSVNEEFYCAFGSQIYYYRADGKEDLDNRALGFDLFSEFNSQENWNGPSSSLTNHALDLYNTIKIDNQDVCDDGEIGILCGNGSLDTGEQCDYSSANNTLTLCSGGYNERTVGCDSNCQWPDYVESYQCLSCGDGLFSPLYEECEIGWGDMICADGWNPQPVNCVACEWDSAVDPCEYCGDNICQNGTNSTNDYGENYSTCIQDCHCQIGADIGICQPAYGENSEVTSLGYCDDCSCGDGVVDSTEDCDDMISIGEVCEIDDYAGHIDCIGCAWDGCLADGECGDNVVDGNELCEIGEITICKEETTGYFGEKACLAGCLAWGNCVATEWCGDDIINGPEGLEECDDGMHCENGDSCFDNSVCNGIGDGLCKPRNNDGCDANCKIEPVCGDGVKEGAEQCDDGNTNDCDGCKGDCLRVDNVCGDTNLECEEVCDDGNTKTERCGDGEKNDGDFCNANCTEGFTLNEQCDDEVMGPDDDTYHIEDSGDDDGACVIDYMHSYYSCKNNVCGDGYLDLSSEECDFGEYPAPNDGCNDSSCEIEPVCGDGVPGLGEQCDDGDDQDTVYTLDPNNNDGVCVIDYTNWNISCKINICGDGYLNQVFEKCDDGNRIFGDGCDADCDIEPCNDLNINNWGAFFYASNSSVCENLQNCHCVWWGECCCDCLNSGGCNPAFSCSCTGINCEPPTWTPNQYCVCTEN